MPRNVDIIGNVYNRLTVLDYGGRSNSGTQLYKCQCSCSTQTIVFVRKGALDSGGTKSCGCLRKEVSRGLLEALKQSDSYTRNDVVDIVGKVYGRLTVLKFQGMNANLSMWECRCECGNTTTVSKNCLNMGNTKSCGCLQIERHRASFVTHGFSNHPLYGVYLNIKGRCTRPTDSSWSYYGGRENNPIYLCDEWLNDPGAFINWALDKGWMPGLTIERSNNDGPYSPGNCKMATREEQARNTRKNVVPNIEVARAIRIDPRPVHEICESYDISRSTVYSIKSNNTWKE